MNDTLISEVINKIDAYYTCSFQTDPRQLSAFIPEIFQPLDDVSKSMTKEQIEKLNDVLRLISIAWENNDFVLLRDYLTYELRPLMCGFIKN